MDKQSNGVRRPVSRLLSLLQLRSLWCGRLRSRAPQCRSQRDTHSLAVRATHTEPVPTTQYTANIESVDKANATGDINEDQCPVCLECVTLYDQQQQQQLLLHQLQLCEHRCCVSCLRSCISAQLQLLPPTLSCPVCPAALHPNDVVAVLDDERLLAQYELRSVRQALSADPDARWCPAPHCRYAVVASDCGACPQLVCGRRDCATVFCYHCQRPWHTDTDCPATTAPAPATTDTTAPATTATTRCDQSVWQSAQSPAGQQDNNNSNNSNNNSSSSPTAEEAGEAVDVRACPQCRVPVAKLDDGSCNHMTCPLCGCQFCWLCMRQITDLHYFSLSGCTFWGRRRWSRRRLRAWQLATLLGAPLMTLLVAGVAAPVILVGFPIWVGKKLHHRFYSGGKLHQRRLVVTGVLLSCVASPCLVMLSLLPGVPIMVYFIYASMLSTLLQSSASAAPDTATPPAPLPDRQ